MALDLKRDTTFELAPPMAPSRVAMADENISLAQRMISACAGSILTSLVLTPFDVIRIRIQQQQILPYDKPCCETKALASNTELFWLNKEFCKTSSNCYRIDSTFQGLVTITRNEGLRTLWRGLSLTLFMAVPANVIYFTGYEYIRDHSPIKESSFNSLVCGSAARLLAATSISPVELIKTRLQSIPSSKAGSPGILKGVVRDFYRSIHQKGIRTIFTGLELTLWRDVPFSGIYWSLYEYSKVQFGSLLQANFSGAHNDSQNHWKVFTTSFLAGSLSGSIAALCTHPFDVGKTRLQISTEYSGNQKKPGMFKLLYNIAQNEGPSALLSGLGPRVMKIAPSCAIMISSYEISKKVFKAGNSAD